MSRNYVLVEVSAGEVAETTVIGSSETEVIVLDFDSLEIDTDEARDKLLELDDIGLTDPTGKLMEYKDRLQGIVDEADQEFDEEDDDEEDDLDVEDEDEDFYAEVEEDEEAL